MMTHMQIFILDMIINLIIVLLYLVWKLIAIFILHRKDAKKGVLIRTFVMLVCPLAGAFYFLVSYVVYKLFMHREVDLSDVVFGKDRVKPHEQADEERSRNLAPMEETLAMSDYDNQRTVMMNVLHGNVNESMGAVAEGLGSADTETAHYAASMLQSQLSKFRSQTDAQLRRIEETETEEERLRLRCQLLSYMNGFLRQHLMNGMEQHTYVLKADAVGDAIFYAGSVGLEGTDCEQLCLRLLENDEFERCEKWCGRMTQLFPNMLGTYTVKIKLYYTIHDQERFQEALENLRGSDVIIDKETLDLIRAFM